MKELQQFYYKIRFNDNFTFIQSNVNNYRYQEVEPETEIVMDWNTFYYNVKIGNIPHCYADKYFLTQEPYVKYSTPCNNKIYNKKNFKQVIIKKGYKTIAENEFTFAELQKKLPADDFCEWLKDKNILENFIKTLDK